MRLISLILFLSMPAFAQSVLKFPTNDCSADNNILIIPPSNASRDQNIELDNYNDVENYIDENILRGHEGGNGGDPIRMNFLKIGENILKNYGSSIISLIGEDSFRKMVSRMSIEFIKLTRTPLKDNGGSYVSAIIEDNHLLLYIGEEIPSLSWEILLLQKSEIEKLVLHEMFRLADVNDDNYFYSHQIFDPRKNFFLQEKTRLPDWLIPYTSNELMLFGDKTNETKLSDCIAFENFRLDKIVGLFCEENFGCSVRVSENSSALLRFQLAQNNLNRNLISSIKRIKAKAVFSCHYTLRTNGCHEKRHFIDHSKACYLKLLDEFSPSGAVLLDQHQTI